jgi:ribosomal protein S18 acetylase RimI-like enzyme
VLRDWKLIDVPYYRLDEAADVLARAFATDGIIAHIVPPGTPDRYSVLKLLFKAGCMSRLSQGHALLAAEWNNKIVAVANLLPTYRPTLTPSMSRMWAQVAEALGPEAYQRMEDYVTLREKHKPPRLHHYLISIGVDPEYQSMGFGKALLGSVVQAVIDDPTSAGVMLDTDGEKNLVFYERNGFSVVGREDLGGTEVLYMYRGVR